MDYDGCGYAATGQLHCGPVTSVVHPPKQHVREAFTQANHRMMRTVKQLLDKNRESEDAAANVAAEAASSKK